MKESSYRQGHGNLETIEGIWNQTNRHPSMHGTTR